MNFKVATILLCVLVHTNAQTTCKDSCWSYLQCKNSWINYFNSPQTVSLCTVPTGCSCSCMTDAATVSTTTIPATQQGTCGKDCSTYLSCKYSWEIFHNQPQMVASFCSKPAACSCGAICYDQAAVPTTTSSPATTTSVSSSTLPACKKENCGAIFSCKNTWINFHKNAASASACQNPTTCSCGCIADRTDRTGSTVAASGGADCEKKCFLYYDCINLWITAGYGAKETITYCDSEPYIGKPSGCNCGNICHGK